MLKIGTGLLFVPFCLGFTRQLFSVLFTTAYKPGLPYYFIAGCFAYLTMHFLFRKPILTYVFGHELTHALFAVLFGGSVKSFKAGERGGQVAVTKSNFIITLAPYFFPLYTCVFLLLYLISADSLRGAAETLIFFSGATFSFHIMLTVIFLFADQKDIREHGALFSYPLIYLFNVLFGALLVFVLLARKNDFLDFFGNGIIQSIRLAVSFFSMLYGLVRG